VRTTIVFGLFLVLCGCGGPPAGDNLAAVDINAAADAAQGSIDTYAANALETVRPMPRRPSPLAVEPVAVVPSDANRAIDVVRAYFAAIAAGRYRDAWAAWEGGGAASGLSAEAFSAGFAHYASYRATLGPPGQVDAGAGQRFVTVPMTVAGTRDDGTPFALAGTVTLHRTADIDGATDLQKSWHLQQVDLRPAP